MTPAARERANKAGSEEAIDAHVSLVSGCSSLAATQSRFPARGLRSRKGKKPGGKMGKKSTFVKTQLRKNTKLRHTVARVGDGIPDKGMQPSVGRLTDQKVPRGNRGM